MRWLIGVCKGDHKKAFQVGTLLMAPLMMAFAAGVALLLSAINAHAGSEGMAAAISQAPNVVAWAFVSAAISTGLACLGAGVAVAYVGAAALGLLGERPELLGRALIFVGLAEGIAIYGLLIAFYIVSRI